MEVSKACLRAITPSWGAVKVFSAPFIDPTGVREAATMTTSWDDWNNVRKTGQLMQLIAHTIARWNMAETDRRAEEEERALRATSIAVSVLL